METHEYKIARMFLLSVGLLVLLCSAASAQIQPSQRVEFEEIVVSFEVPRLVQADLFVQFDGQTVYLPLVRLFELLDIIDTNMFVGLVN